MVQRRAERLQVGSRGGREAQESDQGHPACECLHRICSECPGRRRRVNLHPLGANDEPQVVSTHRRPPWISRIPAHEPSLSRSFQEFHAIGFDNIRQRKPAGCLARAPKRTLHLADARWRCVLERAHICQHGVAEITLAGQASIIDRVRDAERAPVRRLGVQHGRLMIQPVKDGSALLQRQSPFKHLPSDRLSCHHSSGDSFELTGRFRLSSGRCLVLERNPCECGRRGNK